MALQTNTDNGHTEQASSESDYDESAMQPDRLQLKSQTDRIAFKEFLEFSQQDEPIAVKAAPEQDTSRSSTQIIEKAREYQQELFEKAKEQNLIAVLDTGSGKTLIACLLTRHILGEELIRRSQGIAPKVVVFMANSVHLVRQQASVLVNNLVVAPIVLCGEDKSDVWKAREYWHELMLHNNPIVCTPAILQQCLDAALIRIDQVSLLIFDEAHHTKKNHPYSRIMRTHYERCALDQRPKIFGMTASPIDTKGNVDVSAANLEHLLHSKIITTSDMSIISFAPKPQDIIWTYDPLSRTSESNLTERLRPLCSQLDETKRGFVFSQYASSELGLWCADQAWKYVFDIDEHVVNTMAMRYEQSKGYAGIQDVEQRQAILHDLELAEVLVRKYTSQMVRPDHTLLSPKVLRLKNELLARFAADNNMRGVVFVEQRLTALTLCDCFRKQNIKNLRPGVLVGNAMEKSCLKEHRETLDHFRAGLINLVFATSVADEGIDIPQCNLCVRFDLYKSPIQYMQSRGRARMTGSIYVHMIEKGNTTQEHAVQNAIQSDLYIKEFCQSLPADRLLGHGTKSDYLIAQDSNKTFGTNAGAICDFGNCLLILSRFVASLRYIGSVERETFEEHIDQDLQQFRYIVRLPCSSETQVKGARGEWRQNKQLARRSAAFNCCFLLRSKGHLDENLHSKFRKVKPENHNALLAVSKEKSSYQMIVKPAIWAATVGTMPTEVFVSIINFKPTQELERSLMPIVMLTRHRLTEVPRFVTYIEGKIPTYVDIEHMDHALQVIQAELQELTQFTLDGVFLDIFNKQYEHDVSKMTYWLAPINPRRAGEVVAIADIVDMQAVRRVKAGRVKWCSSSNNTSLWEDRLVCDPRSGRFRYFSRSIATGVKATDPVPDYVPLVSQKSRASIIDFSDSYWKASKKHFAAARWDPDQAVLHADLISTRRNFLEKAPEKDCAPVRCLIAAQPLEISMLDPCFAASCLVWPTIIHRLEAYMIALEGLEKIGLRGVSAELALEAFTKDADDDNAGDQIHFGGRYSKSKNYERLEFLGDSLLKMMTTITVFLRTTCDEEGMHCRRMELLCNQRLFEVSNAKHQLHRYVRARGFDRATWYPEHLTLLKGRGASKSPQPVKHADVCQDLSKKTIADVSEALIGAAVIATQYLPRRYDLGIQAISILVDSPDHAITSWQQLLTMYHPPLWSLMSNDVIANELAVQVKERTGYEFQSPRLLRSAFTHSSDTNSTVPDFQRLEFLGDAVLDWVSISWLFNTNPDRNPQWLTEHKMAMVSNKFLAALAVTLDFDKFISLGTVRLHEEISNYSRRVRTMLADPEVPPSFWTEIDSPPKALSDLIESYLGAVLLDSGFQYYEIEKFFNKHILWFFRDISRYDGYASHHPTSYLHKKFTDEYKCHDFRILSSEQPKSGRIETSIDAGILVHGQVIVTAAAASARVAKVKASKKALDLVEGMTRGAFSSKFGCDCNTKTE